MTRQPDRPSELIEGVRAGDRRSLARAILQACRGVVSWSRVYRLLTAIESEFALPA